MVSGLVARLYRPTSAAWLDVRAFRGGSRDGSPEARGEGLT